MSGAAFQLVTAGPLATLPFGQVPRTQTITYDLLILNPGTSNLVITNVAVTSLTGGMGDFRVNSFTGSLTIGPGVTDHSLSVTFQPTSVVETLESATLQFTSNAISGVQLFTLTGTSALLPTSTNVAGSGSETATATQGVPGTNVVTSAAVTFAPTAIPGGATATITLSASGTAAVTGSGFTNALVQWSSDSGATWFSLAGYGAIPSPFGGPVTLVLPNDVANLSTVQLRVQSTATVPGGPGGTATTTLTISGANASITTAGDTFAQVWDVYVGAGQTFPIFNFGAVTLGNTYTGKINIYNPLTIPISVTFVFDSALGFSLVSTSGANPIPAGNNLTLNFQLVPTVGGSQDDPTAIVISITGSSFSFNVEALYQAPVLVPAFTLVGDQEQTVLALKSLGGQSFLNYFVPGTLCEDAAQLSKQYYFTQPQLNKMLNRIWLFFERLGQIELQCTATTTNPKNTPPAVDIFTSSTAADGLLDVGVFDLQLTSSVAQLSYVPAGLVNSPISIVGFVFKLDEGGEIIEGS